MKACFQAVRLSRLVVMTAALIGALIAVGSATARADDEIIPKYGSDVAKNDCYDTGLGAHEKRTWIEEQDFLIKSAEDKALAFIKQECRNLDKGRFSQTFDEYSKPHTDGHCDVSRDERRGCNKLICFGYSSGTCTVPGRHRLAEALDPKSAPLAAEATAATSLPTAGPQQLGAK